MKNLTQREQDFITKFMSFNDCGAKTSQELLEDNYSCQCKEDLKDLFNNLTPKQIGGFLSSLQEKGVIWIEDARTEGPNLYWVSDNFLEENLDLNF